MIAAPTEGGDAVGDASGMEASLELRRLSAGEGAKLVACIRRCYGESHVDPSLYDARLLDEQLASGRRHSAVALTPDGEVVGHLGLVIRQPGDATADAGLTMVDPRFRGRGLAHALAIELGRVALELGLVGLHDYPVTVHGGTQRLATDRALAVGFLLDNLPADVEFNDMGTAAASAATPSLVRYMGLRPAPEREVQVPAPYRELARSLYERGGLARTLGSEALGPARGGAIDLDLEHDERRGVAKLTLRSLAGSLDDLASAIEAGSSRDGTTQVDLPLSDPATPPAALRLRELGFFFGALLPEFHRGDVLRMQRSPQGAAGSAAPVLESEALRAIADFVLRDAAEVRSASDRVARSRSRDRTPVSVLAGRTAERR